MKLRQFITWVASTPAVALATFGVKRQVIAPEEMYHSAAEMKRAMDRHEAAKVKDREQDLRYLKDRRDMQAKYSAESEARVEQIVKAQRETINRLNGHITGYRDFLKKRNLSGEFKEYLS